MTAPFPASANGIVHAISMPAWEVFDLTARDVSSIDAPIWSEDLHSINCRHITRRNTPWSFAFVRMRSRKECSRPTAQPQKSNLEERHKTVGEPLEVQGTEGLSVTEHVIRWLQRCLTRIRFDPTQLAFVRGTSRELSALHAWRFASMRLQSKGPWVHISNGAMQLPFTNPRRWGAINVLLEHGTVRWSSSKPTSDARERLGYQEMCKEADHIWVTNLDVKTLERVDQLAPGRWTALPHPYHLDSMAPYPERKGERTFLKGSLDAEFLIFSGSSFSFGGDQNKGTLSLLEAFRDLVHDAKVPVGLVVTRWGQDVDAANALFSKYKLQRRVMVLPPMSRVRLQQTMAACDLVSDQFYLDAFGGLAIRALEQGMPVLTRGLSEMARGVIGELPPFVSAHDNDTIKSQVASQVRLYEQIGREKYLGLHRISSRGWFLRRHHHGITRTLQEQRYAQLTTNRSAPAIPNAWALLPDWNHFE